MLTCPHRPPCTACPRFGEPGVASVARLRLEALAARHGLSGVPIIAGTAEGFRTRARLAIRGRLGSPKIGLFESGSHRVVHVPRCRVQHPLINRAAEVVRRALVETRVTCYSDRAHLGLARYLQAVVERESGSVQLVLVANAEGPEPLAACIELIRERLGAELHSLWLNFNREPTNAILGPEFHHCAGPESVVEHFGGPAIHYPPGAFGQSNLEIADRIIGHLREGIPSGARVAELYAGVGAIGLSILERASELKLNELSPASLRGLELGISALDPALRERISVLPGSAAEAGGIVTGADVVIVDPPRKGLDAPLIERLRRDPPKRLLYISCGLEALHRDLEHLTDRALELQSLTAFDLLPYTEHVETVAELVRAR